MLLQLCFRFLAAAAAWWGCKIYAGLRSILPALVRLYFLESVFSGFKTFSILVFQYFYRMSTKKQMTLSDRNVLFCAFYSQESPSLSTDKLMHKCSKLDFLGKNEKNWKKRVAAQKGYLSILESHFAAEAGIKKFDTKMDIFEESCLCLFFSMKQKTHSFFSGFSFGDPCLKLILLSQQRANLCN